MDYELTRLDNSPSSGVSPRLLVRRQPVGAVHDGLGGLAAVNPNCRLSKDGVSHGGVGDVGVSAFLQLESSKVTTTLTSSSWPVHRSDLG